MSDTMSSTNQFVQPIPSNKPYVRHIMFNKPLLLTHCDSQYIMFDKPVDKTYYVKKTLCPTHCVRQSSMSDPLLYPINH